MRRATPPSPSPAVSTVAVAGRTVTLTLAAPVRPGETVTVSYAVPGADPLRDAAGNTFTAPAGVIRRACWTPIGGSTY